MLPHVAARDRLSHLVICVFWQCYVVCLCFLLTYIIMLWFFMLSIIYYLPLLLLIQHRLYMLCACIPSKLTYWCLNFSCFLWSTIIVNSAQVAPIFLHAFGIFFPCRCTISYPIVEWIEFVDDVLHGLSSSLDQINCRYGYASLGSVGALHHWGF